MNGLRQRIRRRQFSYNLIRLTFHKRMMFRNKMSTWPQHTLSINGDGLYERKTKHLCSLNVTYINVFTRINDRPICISQCNISTMCITLSSNLIILNTFLLEDQDLLKFLHKRFFEYMQLYIYGTDSKLCGKKFK